MLKVFLMVLKVMGGLNESKIMEVIKALCVLKVTIVLKVVGPEGLRNHNSVKHNKAKDNQSLHS